MLLLPENVVEEVRNGDGIVIVPDYLSGELLKKVQQEFNDKMLPKLEGNDYKFGRAERTLLYSKLPVSTRATFANKWIMNIADEYFGNWSFSEVFWTHEYRNDQGLEANGHLHFDKIGPTLKFLLYLTDTNKENGAFRFCRKTRKLGEKFRNEIWNNEKDYSKLKNKPEIDYPELGFTADNAESIEGKAGTLIIFDTDSFHMGGIIEKSGLERKVIRLHIRK
jgi:hypothetical protein